MIPVLAKGHLPATPSIPPLSSHFFEQNFPLASHFLTVAPPPEIVRANEYTGCVKVPFPLYKPTHPPHTPHSPPVYKPTCPRHTPLTLLLSTNPRIHYTAHPSLSSCLQTHVPTSHTPHSLPVHKPTHPPHTPHSLPVHKPTCPLHHTPLTLFLSTNPRIHLTHLTLFLSTNTRAHYTAHPSLSSCPQTHASTTPHTPHSLLSTNPRIHYITHPSLSSCPQTHVPTTPHTPHSLPVHKPTHPPHTPHSLPVYKPTHPLHHTPLNPSLPLVQHCLLEALQCCCIRKGRVVEDALHSKLYASLLRVLSALLPEVCGYVTHARFLCVCVCALECAEHFAYLIMWWRMFSPLQAARTLCCCACCAC